MMDVRELYQEIIMDHNRNPRNHRELTEPSCQAQGFNPLCGDKLTVFLNVKADIIQEITFKGCGCAISQASASLMTEILQGKTVAEAHALFARFIHMVTIEDDPDSESMDKLLVLSGVRTFPARVKCATLAWHTLESALHDDRQTVTTE